MPHRPGVPRERAGGGLSVVTSTPSQPEVVDQLVDHVLVTRAAVHAHRVLQVLLHAQVVVEHRRVGQPRALRTRLDRQHQLPIDEAVKRGRSVWTAGPDVTKARKAHHERLRREKEEREAGGEPDPDSPHH